MKRPMAWLCLLLGLGAWMAGAAAAETPEDVLRQAYQFERAGDVAKAADTFRKFLKEYPDHNQVTDAHYRLAKAADSLGLVEESVAQLQAVVQADKKGFRNRTDAFFMLAKTQGSQKNYDAAIATLEKMLSEGAGLYEDEARNLCGTYHAIREKWTEAATQFNLIAGKPDSPLAEQAAYKLVQLWLRAQKMDLAAKALEDLSERYPNHARLPDLLLEMADIFRQHGQLDKAIAVSEQLKSRFPKTTEAQGANLILGLCFRDRKEFKKAVEVLVTLSKFPELQKRGLAAEAMLTVADITFAELADQPKAMEFYEEAAKLARDSESGRKHDILEVCYFRLAEYNFQQKRWGVALEDYLLLRQIGTKLNIINRMMVCQDNLGVTADSANLTPADEKFLRDKIAENAGTAQAAEWEVMLTDRRLSQALQNRRSGVSFASEYEGILKKYSPQILANNHLASYVNLQLGQAWASGTTKDEVGKAIGAFENAVAKDPETPYQVPALEYLAFAAERVGDKKKAIDTYEKLYRLAEAAKDPQAKPDPARKGAEGKALDYLRALASRADSDDLVQKTVNMLKKVIEDKGPLSEEARESRFYLGELYFVKKDYSLSAKAYKEFILAYGPKCDEQGDVAGGPWKPATVDAKVEQVYEASVRIAHCWYMQGHQQNMVQAYAWLAKNFPHQNKYVPEANYWLIMNDSQTEEGKKKEVRRVLADRLWKSIVHPSLDFNATDFAKNYYPWANPNDSRFTETQKYVRGAMMKTGQFFAESGCHELAAGAFSEYLNHYAAPVTARPGGGNKRVKEPQQPQRFQDLEAEELASVARYALGREYVALNNLPKLIEAYRPYLNHLRDDQFRVSALKLMAYRCGKGGKLLDATEAYAALLDEYGTNPTDSKGNLIPVPRNERLRQDDRTNWDGYRMEVPKDLDLGEVRYALAYLYYTEEQFDKVVKTAAPFMDDESLKANKARDKVLFMAAKSYQKQHDDANTARALLILIRDHPRFEALEEVFTLAARACCETKQWNDVELLCRRFTTLWPKSDFQPRMDLYAALAQLYQGKTDLALRTLRGIVDSDSFEDVRADAAYHMGLQYASAQPPKLPEAYKWLGKSVEVFARENSCLELGRVCMKLGKWPEAQTYLQRASQEFPRGNRKFGIEAEKLLPLVQKELAKVKEKGN